ncbi:MAG TPA: glycosyltransferase [Deltaproteobacteria bacterium]|nr:glycosyltransferase [Deltaproteobacteria bacterium]
MAVESTVQDEKREDIEKSIERIDSADIVVGIASYNNASTITHVVRAVDAGLAKYFPRERCVIINSDGGSTDHTPELVKNTDFDHRTIFLSHPLYPIHRITTPYHGIPGKGSAFRTIFELAKQLNVKACCVVDADLRSITPEWIELLLIPVLKEGYDFVAPFYSRHKYDGSITNSIIYPVTRALYGKKIRQPIGGEFGMSGRLIEHYLSLKDAWDTDVARFGIDIWMTTEAIAGGFNLCQAYLGAKIHDPKDPGVHLTDMFVQVVGSLMKLTERHHDVWKQTKGTEEVPTFGFKFYTGLEPISVNIDRMIELFRLGVDNLKDVWGIFLVEDLVGEIERIARSTRHTFHFPDEVWVRIVYEYMLAFHHKKLSLEHLLKSMVPLYHGRTASFFLEVASLSNDEAEEKVEKLCQEFERQKKYLVELW